MLSDLHIQAEIPEQALVKPDPHQMSPLYVESTAPFLLACVLFTSPMPFLVDECIAAVVICML